MIEKAGKLFALKIPSKLRNELEEFATNEEKSMTRVILDALKFYLDHQKGY